MLGLFIKENKLFINFLEEVSGDEMKIWIMNEDKKERGFRIGIKWWDENRFADRLNNRGKVIFQRWWKCEL